MDRMDIWLKLMEWGFNGGFEHVLFGVFMITNLLRTHNKQTGGAAMRNINFAVYKAADKVVNRSFPALAIAASLVCTVTVVGLLMM